MSIINHVSDTAFWVATFRAQETNRPDALFKDPLAEVLTGERGKKIAHFMRQTTRRTYWTLVTRTLLIDGLIQNYINQGGKNIINLGAGLDARPYRLNLSKDINWFEMDFKDVIDYKNEKLKNYNPQCNLQRIAVDLSVKELRENALNEINNKIKSALVITEGVTPYLTEDQVRELAIDLKEEKNIRYWITEYYDPKIYKLFKSKAFQKRLGNAPFKFFPKDIGEFYSSLNWKISSLNYLYDVGEKVSRPMPLPFWVKIIQFFIGREKLAKRLRLTGYFLLET